MAETQPRLRHVAVQVKDIEASAKFYFAHGFEILSSGEDNINGNQVTWLKMVNADGFTLELVVNWPGHLSFTVEKLDSKKYIQVAPSGYMIQFDHDPDGNIIEYVKKEG